MFFEYLSAFCVDCAVFVSSLTLNFLDFVIGYGIAIVIRIVRNIKNHSFALLIMTIYSAFVGHNIMKKQT